MKKIKNRLPSEWNRENEGAIVNQEQQEASAVNFFVKQKVQVDEMQGQQDSEVLFDADGK